MAVRHVLRIPRMTPFGHYAGDELQIAELPPRLGILPRNRTLSAWTGCPRLPAFAREHLHSRRPGTWCNHASSRLQRHIPLLAVSILALGDLRGCSGTELPACI